jgi:hypothetical protein
MDMDPADKTTQEFEGPGMVSKVDPILRMNINGDDGDDIIFADIGGGIPNPYQQYSTDGGASARAEDRSLRGGSNSGTSRPKSGKKSSSSSSSSNARPDAAVSNSSSSAAMGVGSSSSSGSRPKSATRRTNSRDADMPASSSASRDSRQTSEDYYQPKSGVRK